MLDLMGNKFGTFVLLTALSQLSKEEFKIKSQIISENYSRMFNLHQKELFQEAYKKKFKIKEDENNNSKPTSLPKKKKKKKKRKKRKLP